MAIVINSLTPTNPVTVLAGASVTFAVSASSTTSSTLSYQWQFSTDGITYTSAGLVNFTSATFTTSNFTSNQTGLYFRVQISSTADGTVFSNEYPGIGNRQVTVISNPTILTQINNLIDFYPTSKTVQVGEAFAFTASATLGNVDITNTNLVSGINFQWQYSPNNGTTWINVSVGGDVSVSNTVAPIPDASPVQYYKYSTITVSNTTFQLNLYQYRVVISYTGADNSPVTLSSILLLVSPQITIYRQPGTGNDTTTSRCYKTSDSTSGKIKLQVGALSTANTTLTYQWQASLNDTLWFPIQNLIDNYNCSLKSGTTSVSDVLELEKFIFYNKVGFRCVINGSSGETQLVSNTAYVYMSDVQVSPIIPFTTVNIEEDRYGDITDRRNYSEIIKSVFIQAQQDLARNTGINGDIRLIFERKNPGSITWSEIGLPITQSLPSGFTSYVQFPTNEQDLAGISYETPPLRRSTDNGAKYRLKVEASSRYTLSGSTKTIVPYYSSEITVNVYRTVYITNQPVNATVYTNANASFSVTALPSSGSSSDISYQWQYNTANLVTGWQNVPSNSKYSGVNTNLLLVNSVVANESYKYFRCIISITDQLSSTTTNVVQIITERDYFTEISSLNDAYVNEFENVTFSVTASTLSNGPISYQWQKSTNYNPSTQTGTWSNISGYTQNSFTLLSVSTANNGYYRCKLTSFGGEIEYTNAAYLFVTPLRITITKNTPTTITVLEGDDNAYTFETLGVSSLDNDVNYQWQKAFSSNPAVFSSIGDGYLNSPDTGRIYYPKRFDKDIDNLCKIRCQLSATGIPGFTYTNQTTVNINRRFSYVAGPASLTLGIGSTFIVDLNPSWTGGFPSYMWQESTNGGSTWTDMGETQEVLVIGGLTASYSGRKYRCKITLSNCNQHAYTRNNVQTIISVNPVDYTQEITLNVVAVTSENPTYYSKESVKTGAAIGTVICVPKPSGFVRVISTSADDISSWKVSISGSTQPNSDTTSIVTSGSVWASNKPSWASSYSAPKWVTSQDRFPGYIEMRGQYLRASEFPELAKQLGTTYGGSITGTYPTYSSSDFFRMPLVYGKRLMGTGNVDNNTGSVSLTPEYNPNGTSGGDKNVPGSIGGRYNYGRSGQLPPGSPGIGGEDGSAGVDPRNPETFSLGTFKSTGVTDVNNFVQPTMAGTVSWSLSGTGAATITNPIHNHQAVVAAFEQRGVSGDCYSFPDLVSGLFRETRPADGQLLEGPPSNGSSHSHGANPTGGSFNIMTQGNVSISDTTLRLSGQSTQLFNNSLGFYLRNNEILPIYSEYFRLKYMMKAY